MSDPRLELHDLLSSIRRRWTILVRLQWTGRTAALAAAPLLAAAALWTGIAPGWPVTGMAAGGVVVAVVSIVILAVRAGERSPDDRRLARFIEEAATRRHGSSSDAIVTAVQVASRAGPAGAFDELVLRRAVSDLRLIHPADVVLPTALRRAVLGAAFGLTLLGAGLFTATPMLRAGMGDAWVRIVPRSVEITVLGGDARVQAGEGLIIRAAVGGPGARWLSRPPAVVITADGDAQQLEMAQSTANGTFAYEVDSVTRSFAYQVRAAGAVSGTYHVTAVRAPRVTRIDVHYIYPAFTKLEPRHEEDGGDIYGPAGTEVRLLVHTDTPAVEGSLERATGGSVRLAVIDANTLSADLVLAEDDTYRVGLVDRDDLRSNGETEYFIRVMSDRPPAVRIVRPAADRGITPLQEVVIEARADDDYGIAAFDLVITVAGRPPRMVPFARLDGSPTARSGRYTLEAESLNVQPGDVITYFARARDVPRGRRSVETRSEIFFLEVQPFSEAFVAAESRGAGGAGATPLDSLVAAQKEIISATWNLERRALAGRSTDDVRAVERAQRELRTRAERMQNASGGRRPGIVQQIRMPPPGRGAGSPDHVALALEAMDRAAEQLSTARTADAIPHELGALRALLQAQAEIRRRQVVQQASTGGGGGSGRADRDLSALFDRELQRQQETRYEVPPGGPPDEEPEPPSDLADRVRELAARQADLARDQRELTANARSPEERERELARLSREQEELRRRMEALNLGKTDASGAPQSVAESAGGMERAAEAMGRAVREMRGASPERAAAHADRAVEALSQAERELRGGQSGRRREVADLRVDAQQLIEGQRRIATEAARLAKDDPAHGRRSADARQQLAGEQRRLADRVDAFERAARGLGSDESAGDERARLAAVADHLQSEQISERMREAARQMSADGARGDTGEERTDAQQQLARAMETLLDRLGGADDGVMGGRAQGDGAGDLDRALRMRDELNRLERQVRDAEARLEAAGRTPPAAGRGGRGRGESREGERTARDALQRAREAYARALERARTTLARVHDGVGGSTPEHHEFSRASPGTEAFTQDVTEWESLRARVDLALERYEAAAATKRQPPDRESRLSAGASDRVPDTYRRMVSRYFEAIARTAK